MKEGGGGAVKAGRPTAPRAASVDAQTSRRERWT